MPYAIGRRRGLVGLLLGLAVASGALVLLPATALALSCAGWEEDPVLAAARDELPAMPGQPAESKFSQSYDFVVVGQVRKVDEAFMGGKTSVTVDVQAGLFDAELPSEVILSMADRSYMGYPFEVGPTYFIPVQERGGGDMTNYVMACFPVRVVTEAQTAEMLAVAKASGTTISTVAVDGQVPPPSGTGGEAGGAGSAEAAGMTAAVTAWGVVVAAVVAAGAVVAVRRSRRAGTPAD